MAGQVHVIYSKAEGWHVKLDGFDGALVSGYGQKETERLGRSFSKDLKGELVIHSKTGRIRVKDSHGKDSPKRKG